jgi:glycosyltransferase involved in cell wall biosynthesis
MAVQPRILTFNFHEPYLCLMAKTGLRFDVGHYAKGMLARNWNTAYRSPGPNLNLLTEREWRERLAADAYDVIIAHNEMNALDVARAHGAKLLVMHNRRTFLNTSVTSDEGNPIEALESLLDRLQNYFEFVFISESKQDDYGYPGRIIPPGIDVEEMGGYVGDERRVLRVGNMMRTRNLMFDVDFQETVCKGLPCRVAGADPFIPEARCTESFEDLLRLYRHHRCLLHVSRDGFEDGYNLATLEAMACGMPVVTLSNWTSPIRDGVDGYASYDPVVLHQRLALLLDNLDLAREIGARGRETVARKFPIADFCEKWRTAIFEAAEGVAGLHRRRPSSRKHTRILMDYTASPITTGRYFELAAREKHNVFTIGLRVPEQVFKNWGFEEETPPYAPHQLNLPLNAPYAQVMANLPRGYAADYYLWIDSGLKTIAPDIDLLPMPKLAYLIDTHVAPEPRIEIARNFDCVFLAQVAQVELFRNAGIAHCYWLPLACWPPLHDIPPQERIYDVAYVGSLNPQEHGRRMSLLNEIARRFPNCKMGRAWPETMATIYAQSKIVVNIAYNRDVNMRVFEALASGALLITDEAEGLDTLFQDGAHLVVYHRDEDVFDLIEEYLADPEARQRIARNGQAYVLAQHTYRHRIAKLLECSRAVMASISKAKNVETGKDESYYEHPRREIFNLVPQYAERVLDVGCGAGALGSLLKEERGVKEVVGIELVAHVAERAREVLDTVLVGSIEALELPFEDGRFDCIICADVLEHLEDPAGALRKLARVLSDDGVILISVPNASFFEVVGMLVSGAWTYMDAGIMDSTHLRFFTPSSIPRMIAEAGLEMRESGPLNAYPGTRFSRNPDGTLRFGKLTLHDVSEEDYTKYLAIQYYCYARKPGQDGLSRARAALDTHQNEAAAALAADAVGSDPFARKRLIAKALARMGRLAQADDLYREVLALKDDPAVGGEYGILLIGMNRAHEAKAFLERALEANPGQDRMEGAYGLVLLTEGDTQGAYAYLKRALEANFEHISLLWPLMEVAADIDAVGDIEPLVRSFAEFYPGDMDLSAAHAALLIGLGRFEEARDRLDLILLFEPNHSRARELLQRHYPTSES